MSTGEPWNVLFLCTGNSARSVLAEVYLNAAGKGRFHAYSAGSHPKGEVNPLSIDTLKLARLPVENLRSKSWDEFARPDAPQMDFVITVCDQAAGEVCPIWPGQPINAHWSFADPASFAGTELERRAYFQEIFRQIRRRIDLFCSLPLSKLDTLGLKRELDVIGNTKA